MPRVVAQRRSVEWARRLAPSPVRVTERALASGTRCWSHSHRIGPNDRRWLRAVATPAHSHLLTLPGRHGPARRTDACDNECPDGVAILERGARRNHLAGRGRDNRHARGVRSRPGTEYSTDELAWC